MTDHRLTNFLLILILMMTVFILSAFEEQPRTKGATGPGEHCENTGKTLRKYSGNRADAGE